MCPILPTKVSNLADPDVHSKPPYSAKAEKWIETVREMHENAPNAKQCSLVFALSCWVGVGSRILSGVAITGILSFRNVLWYHFDTIRYPRAKPSWHWKCPLNAKFGGHFFVDKSEKKMVFLGSLLLNTADDADVRLYSLFQMLSIYNYCCPRFCLSQKGTP